VRAGTAQQQRRHEGGAVSGVAQIVSGAQLHDAEDTATPIAINGGTLSVSYTGGRSSNPLRTSAPDYLLLLGGGDPSLWSPLVLTITSTTALTGLVLVGSGFAGGERFVSLSPLALSVEPDGGSEPTIANGGTELHSSGSGGPEYIAHFADVSAAGSLQLTFTLAGSTSNVSTNIRRLEFVS